MKTAILTLQLVVGVILIQWHAVQFWTEEVDPHAGWALAIMIEVVALSFWWSRSIFYRLLAFTATVMLLAGPMYHLGEPVYTEIMAKVASDKTDTAALPELDRRIAKASETLETYRDRMAQGHSGLAKYIENQEQRLDTLQDERIAMMSRTASEPIRWEEVAPVVMYIWVLLLVQVNNVRMVRLLSDGWAAREAAKPRKEPEPQPKPAKSIRLVRQANGQRLGVKLQGEGLSEALA